MTRGPVLLRTHNGFGDVIYERPVVAAFADAHPEPVYLATAWPELFADLPLRLVPAESRLTWSQLNMSRQPHGTWHPAPSNARKLDLRLKPIQAHLSARSMIDLMAGLAGVRVGAFSLPDLPGSPVSADRIALIRPVTVRGDWPHHARNPLPEYMRAAALQLREAGFHVVSVASISPREPYLGERPFAHQRFDRGELGPLELLALVRASDVVVTGPGWAVPAALAAGTPLIVIAGGAGGTNGPQALVPSWYHGDVTWISPPGFCQCQLRQHSCRKAIPGFAREFGDALAARVAA